ncbi:MAG TPA: hypothetical protein G4O12_07205, partial [Dehalococcoidia bacterium]|nr:hypothetical protein [Dehalococcoidia bacterium]
MFNWIIGIPLFVLFAAVGLAIAVIPWTHREPSRPVLDILVISVVLWSFGSVMVHSVTFPSTLFWMHFILACGSCTGGLGVHFSAQLTQQRDRIKKPLVTTVYAATFLLVVLAVSGQFVDEATLLPNGAVVVNFGTMAPLVWGILGIGILIAIFFLISTLIRSPQSARKYLIFPLVGFMVMCLGSLTNLITTSYPIEIAANFVFLGLVTYGAIGTHLLKPVVRRPWQVSSFAIFSLLALCYIAVLTFCLEWLRISHYSSHLIAALIVIAFGTVIFRPSREFLSATLTKGLFPSVYNYKRALAEIANQDSSLATWGDSVARVLDTIIKVTKADGAILLLENDETESFEASHVRGLDPADFSRICLSKDSPTIRYLEVNRDSIVEGEMEPYGKTNGSPYIGDSKSRELYHAVYCGVRGYQRLLAVLAVVPKSHRTYLGPEEKDFIIMASNQIAPIIGNVLLYQASQREIAERKRMEEERMELERKAHLSSHLASVGEMASGIAHEINNPLTGVIGFSQLLLQRDIPEDIREDVKTIHDGAQRVAGIVKRLLTFARQYKPERNYVNINDIVETTLALRAYELKTGNIEVTTQLAPDLPGTVADAGQLQQVFLNLIINAETEMKLAHGKGKLIIKTEKVDSTIKISFRDDGPGIAEENLERIFSPFFTTRKVGQGTGLGLSVCHGIIAEHEGRIYAESQLHKGATFIVELPIITKLEQLEPSEPSVGEPQKVTKARMLIVDDEP